MTGARAGLFDTGTIGAAMVANVARAGPPLTAWNRTPGRAALSVTALARQIEAALVAKGHGDDDHSALARAIQERSGL